MSFYFYLLFFSTIIILLLLIFTNKTKKSQITAAFTMVLLCFIIWNIGLLLQLSLSDKYNINPIFFDYFTYIGICFLPVAIFFVGLIFNKTKIVFRKSYLLLFIIPTLSLILLWTNNYHHLFYVYYSTDMDKFISGIYSSTVHVIYTYGLIIVSLVLLLKYSIKNSGFFSKQALLLIFGSLFPIIVNVLGSFNVIPMTIYITPISFTFTILFWAIAIFRFRFLSIAPIALQRIVDRISDGYIVLNEDYKIIDFNETFLKLFNGKSNDLRNAELFDLIISHKIDINIDTLSSAIQKTKNNNDTVKIEKYFKSINKFFNVEINSITNKNSFLGTLILLKDVTQHNIDMQIIKDNQEMLIEKERLASLGQMIGGIAHNLKTPIMSLAGGLEGLSMLTKEYDDAIGDIEVTEEDNHEIVKDMNKWITKMKSYISYMSDVITAIKGQAIALSNNKEANFTIDELVKYIDILMKHELKNSLIDLNINVKVPANTILNGNVNSLVQVLNNIISNAIQAYNGKPNMNIDFTIYKEDKNIIFKVEDSAGGLPDKVKEKLFKEMITTKGKNGSGLGLFMSYSNIKAHFNGNMTCDSVKGKGTTFYISIPC